MSFSWSNEKASGLRDDPEFARKIARTLSGDALFWARAFASCASSVRLAPGKALPETGLRKIKPSAESHEVENELFVEVLSYSLSLLEMRLSKSRSGASNSFVAAVRRECGVMMGQGDHGTQTRSCRPPDARPSLGGSAYDQLILCKGARYRGRLRLTKEVFDQFCECTGLGSDVLVGSGENLASIIFYVTLHGMLSCHARLTREAVQRMLRIAADCRKHFQRTILTINCGEAIQRVS